jgi:hypothetical protein
MTKRYTSSARVVIGVITEDGGYTRIAFHPLTGGGSYFETSDEKLQRAIERNSGYRRSFIGREVEEQVAPAPVIEEEPKGPKQVNVASLDDAKDYLAEKFGYSRTKLRSKAAILAAAEESGIEFIGI